MREKDLHERFVNYLHLSYPKRRELTTILTDILKIERESIVRRLNGKVLFTVNEIGRIAEELDFSIDPLLKENPNRVLLPLDLVMPSNVDSVDSLIQVIANSAKILKKMTQESPVYTGQIFDSLPLEFFIPYTNLCKFMYFKWMNYLVKDNFYNDYASWQIPMEIKRCQDELMDCWNDSNVLFYIWDNPVIWNLTKEIEYLYKMRILNLNDVELIKKDLHGLLNDVELRTRGINDEHDSPAKSIDMYVSSVNIGMSCTYFQSSTDAYVYYKAPFFHSVVHQNGEMFDKMYEWINSMKRISTLITGCGAIERRLFFDEQHIIVDMIKL